MDFNDTPEEAAFRKEVRTWLDANATRKSDDSKSFRARNDDPNLLKKAKEWQGKKGKAGYAPITRPKEDGGPRRPPVPPVEFPPARGELPRPPRLFPNGSCLVHPNPDGISRACT